MPDPVVLIASLPELLPGRHLLEGYRFGLANLTLVLGNSPPARAPRSTGTTTRRSLSSTPDGARTPSAT